MKKITIYTLLFILTFISCNVDDNITTMNKLSFYVSASRFVNSSTRAIDNVYSTSFVSGDKIGLYVVNSSGIVTTANICLTYDGTNWNYPNGTEPLYYSSATTNFKFFVYYPYQTTLNNGPSLGSSPITTSASTFFSSAVTSWNILTDQSTHDKYTAVDFMAGIGVLGTSVQNNAYYLISFNMMHQLSLIELNFPYTSGSTLNLTCNMFSSSNTWNAWGTFLPYHISNGTYRYLVKPNNNINIQGTFYKSSTKYSFGTSTFISPSLGKYYSVTFDGGTSY